MNKGCGLLCWEQVESKNQSYQAGTFEGDRKTNCFCMQTLAFIPGTALPPKVAGAFFLEFYGTNLILF